MTLNIKDAETDRLARALAAETGESLTAAVAVALRERLERVRGVTRHGRLADELDEIGQRCASLPIIDRRTDDEILGYGPDGAPV